MAAVDIGNNAVVLDLEAIFKAMDDNAPVFEKQRVIVGISVTTACMSAKAALCGPPGGRELAYYLGLGGAFFAGMAGLWAAHWISGDAPARRAKGKMILYASFVALVIAASLGGFAINLKS